MKISCFSLLHLWNFSLIFNSIFIIIPYQGMHTYTIFSIPLGYMLFIITFLFIIIFNKFRIEKINSLIRYSIYGILFYCMFSVLIVKNYRSWFIYLVMWVFYVLSFLSLIRIYNRHICLKNFITYLKNIIFTFSIISLIGIFRFLFLKFGDANPWAFINKNGYIFSIVPFIPIILAAIDYGMYKTFKFLIIFIIIFINIILVFSRTAYIGLVFSLFMYYIIYHIVNFYRINLLSLLRRILRFLLVTILLYILMINIPHFKEKIIIGFETVNKVIKFGEIKEGESDYRRYLLIKESIRIFKEHWLLGTGLGLENYLYYFNENTIPAKPHSLYLSYLAEFGLIGFSFLVLFLFSILQVLYKTILYTIGKKEVYLSIGFFVGHLTILIMFLFNEYITAPYTWFFWATAVAYSLLVRKER